MARFDIAVEWLLRHEGGWSDVPQDRGGRTKYGITEDVAKAYGYAVEQLTIPQAKAIYRAKYWRFDGLESQRIATKALDMSANMGPSQGIKLLQRASNDVLLSLKARAPVGTHIPHQLIADGMMGPTTETAIDFLYFDQRENDVLSAIVKQQALFYARIVNANAKLAVPKLRRVDPKFKLQAVFTLGWIDRAFDVPE